MSRLPKTSAACPPAGEAYTILLFDADGTLLDFTAAEGKAFVAAMTACGAAEDEALRVLPVYRRINDDLWKENEKGNITKSELKAERWRRLGEECGLPASLLEGAAPLYSRFLSERGDLLPGAAELLQALAERGKRLFLITNGLSSSQYGRIRAAGIEELFEGVFVSEELGCSKPDPRFFHAAAEKIPCFEKDKALIIGDRLSSDIAMAAAVGVPCIWITGEKSAGACERAVLFKASSLSPLFPFFLGESFPSEKIFPEEKRARAAKEEVLPREKP